MTAILAELRLLGSVAGNRRAWDASPLVRRIVADTKAYVTKELEGRASASGRLIMFKYTFLLNVVGIDTNQTAIEYIHHKTVWDIFEYSMQNVCQNALYIRASANALVEWLEHNDIRCFVGIAEQSCDLFSHDWFSAVQTINVYFSDDLATVMCRLEFPESRVISP